jgi:hypothetical protein
MVSPTNAEGSALRSLAGPDDPAFLLTWRRPPTREQAYWRGEAIKRKAVGRTQRTLAPQISVYETACHKVKFQVDFLKLISFVVEDALA